jgi:hypothetical protein
VVIGGAVDFHFDMLLLPGDNDVASVPANIDSIAVVGHGEVVKVARLLLVLCYALAAFGAFDISEPAAFSLNVIFIFYLHSICGVEIVFK